MRIDLKRLISWEREMNSNGAKRSRDFVFDTLTRYYLDPERADEDVQEMMPILGELAELGIVSGLPEEESK